MELLGWSLKAEKDLAFASEFDVLGVCFQVGKALATGTFSVANTERRRLELRQTIGDYLVADALTAPEAASLAGKL
eukprot:2125186-Alexandrium_andersonii.AAC.1